MITYRKAAQLRIERPAEPEAPFWAATVISPYAGRRMAPLSINFRELTASSTERSEVRAAGAVADLLSREARPLDEPVLIDCSGFAESVYRRGEAAAEYCTAQRIHSIQLVSAEGDGARSAREGLTIAIASWPCDMALLSPLFRRTRDSGHRWGVVVPVIYPVTTDLGVLSTLVEAAASQDASFVASFTPELDPSGRHAVATLAGIEEDEETYQELFHSDLELINVATERHIAALAHALGVADFVSHSGENDRTNWNAATMLARCAGRVMRGRQDAELGWEILRSARLVAALGKPLERIAESASLSIIEGIDEISLDMLEQWLSDGRAEFAETVDAEWRLRRDHGLSVDSTDGFDRP